MNFFKKFPVAVAITALVVALCVGYGVRSTDWNTYDPTDTVVDTDEADTDDTTGWPDEADTDDTTGWPDEADTDDTTGWPEVTDSGAENYYCIDGADILSTAAEKMVANYNNRWDSDYGAHVLVVTVDSLGSTSGEDYCYELADEYSLTEADMVFVIEADDNYAYLVEGGNYSDLDIDSLLEDYLGDEFLNEEYDSAVLSLMSGLDDYLLSYYLYADVWDDGYCYTEYVGDEYDDFTEGEVTVITILVLILIGVAIVNAIDRARYRRWYGMYGHMATPPVLFHPIFFWNRGLFGPGPGPHPGGPRGGHGGDFGGPRGGHGGGFGGGPRRNGGGGFGGGHGGGFGGGGGGHGGSFGGGGGGGHGGGFGR